ncbi:MAG: response regulator transcription factor [Bacillota bacterium]
MADTNVLVVDDEVKIRELVRDYLLREGYGVEEAGNGMEARERMKSHSYDLIILDLMMPGENGLDLCREIRKTSDVPIIMLTARGDEIDRVIGLELGADDYMVKPFSPREMVARVKAILRRARKNNQCERNNSLIELEGLVIDDSERRVSVNGEEISLTPKEYDLLAIMARNPGRVLTREQLLQQVWGYDFYGEARTVDTHITRLREKLSRVLGDRQLIATVWGVGYKFEVK